MKTDAKTHHVPRYFEYISQLGASLLVDATGKLFRDYDYIRRFQSQSKQPENKPKTAPERQTDKRPDELAYESEDDEVVTPEVRAKRYKEEAEKHYEQNQETLNAMAKAQPLLTLEYLVSSLSIFDVTNPHDSIYALLGISKDTTPTAANKKLLVTDHTQSVLEMFTEKKQYNVDYTADYIDICKEFIEFCVHQNVRRDPSRALDVFCRPFAIEVEQKADGLPFPSWIPRLSKASYGMDRGPGIDGLRMGRKNADSLVGLPNVTHRNYNAAETKKLEGKVFRFRKRAVPKPKDNESAANTEESRQAVGSHSMSSSAAQEGETHEGATNVSSSAKIQEFGGPRKSVEPGKAGKTRSQSTSASSSASHAKDAQTVTTPNAGRQKEKPTMIASPEAFMDTKSAATVSKSSSESLQPTLNHFSLFVQGFVLDTIAELQNSSQSGSIPAEWAHFANWDMITTPPEHFWRTLVADRGGDGKNPPVYYARACQESFRKGNVTSGVVDTTGLIEHERNSVVAQFCRRVQAAIWNRALVKTKAARLGLVAANVREGDLVCILYGCSVPVILRPHGPKKKDVMESEMRWELNFLANHVGKRYHSRLDRRELFRKKREQDKKDYKLWEDKKRKELEEDKEWGKQWPLVQAGLMQIHEFRIWVMKKRLSELGNANDCEDTKAVIQSYVNVLVPQIYDIATWATQSGHTKKNIMDQLQSSSNDESFREPFKLTEDQKKLWDLFRKDTVWKDWLKKENEKYLNHEGFCVWAANVYKKPIEYPDDREKAQTEWSKKPAKKWATDWSEQNSWFLCIDSFRAWLRERGKFCGSEELLNSKQKWEAANPTSENIELEVKSFNAWMRKEGLENPDRQESKINELRKRFEAWRTAWLSENPEATLPESMKAEQSKWTKIEQELKDEMNQEDEKRKKEAQRRDKEPFLERWRKGWKPEKVNWEEFEIMLSYGRYWVKLMKKGKRDYMKEWSEPPAIKQRQSTRADYFLKKKGDRAIKYPNLLTLDGTGERAGIEYSISIIDEQVVTGVTPSHTSPSNPDPFTVANNDHPETVTEPSDLNDDISPNLKSHVMGPLTVPNHSREGPNQTTGLSSQPFSQSSNSENHSAVHGKGNQEALHNPPVNVEDERNQLEKPSLNRFQTNLKPDEIKRMLLEYPEKLSESGFASKKVLDYWVEQKKSQLQSQWAATQTRIEKDLAIWLRDAPRVIGKDGKFHLNYSRPSNVEKELQKKRREKQRLEKKQKLEERQKQEEFEEQQKGQHVMREVGIDHGEHAEEETDEEGAEEVNEKKGGEKLKEKIEEEGHEKGVREDNEKVAEEDEKRGQEEGNTKEVYVLIRATQRLTEEEKVEYTEDIETNFTTKMRKYGEGGQWHYEMMGECYVYGMMDGEAMAYQNNEGKPTTVFEIR